MNEARPHADVAFELKDKEVCQLGSLIQNRKNEFKKIPGMEKFSEMLETMTKMDHTLNCVSVEYGQLRSLTQGVLPQMRHIQCDGNGDWLALNTLIRKAAGMKSQY